MDRYEQARELYAEYGIDTEKALKVLAGIPISLHCWQADDIKGFSADSSLSGGIQVTGNYPGAARTPEELLCDYRKAFSMLAGKKKINIHASYAVQKNGVKKDRDGISFEDFEIWTDFAGEYGCGIDFNPTFFSHPLVKDNLTLSSPDESVRKFWVDHGKACIKIAQYFAEKTGTESVVNFWMPDGFKDVPADRKSSREVMMRSLDEILACGYDKTQVFPALESKVFGIGLESCTVGSSEFSLCYAASRGIVPLMDNGHYHPTESVADKIPTLLLFFDRIALHITRSIRWDSDHVVTFDDETRAIAEQICNDEAYKRIFIALDYFDASINRIAAWVSGYRNLQKALLAGLLMPGKQMLEYQNNADFTRLFMLREELKTLPFSDVWNRFCEENSVVSDKYLYGEVKKYEDEILSKRV